MIQNRTTIVISAQPEHLEVVVERAIRKTRLPVSLKEPTWRITESGDDDEQPAEEDEQQLGAGEDGQPGDRAAEGQRAGVAHEDPAPARCSTTGSRSRRPAPAAATTARSRGSRTS